MAIQSIHRVDRARSAPAKKRPKATRSKTSHSRSGNTCSGNTGEPRKSFDRYTELALAANVAGDTIDAENYYQHAEHYYRQMNHKAA